MTANREELNILLSLVFVTRQLAELRIVFRGLCQTARLWILYMNCLSVIMIGLFLDLWPWFNLHPSGCIGPDFGAVLIWLVNHLSNISQWVSKFLNGTSAQQSNSTDCCIHVLEYAERFFKQPTSPPAMEGILENHTPEKLFLAYSRLPTMLFEQNTRHQALNITARPCGTINQSELWTATMQYIFTKVEVCHS